MRNVAVVLFLMSAVLLCGCPPHITGGAAVPETIVSSAGVELHGVNHGRLNDSSVGYLQNTNPFPVRIRVVMQDESEITRGVHFIPARGHLYVAQLDDRIGFYIYTTDGALVGWLKEDAIFR